MNKLINYLLNNKVVYFMRLRLIVFYRSLIYLIFFNINCILATNLVEQVKNFDFS